jgi:hypothetical protein
LRKARGKELLIMNAESKIEIKKLVIRKADNEGVKSITFFLVLKIFRTRSPLKTCGDDNFVVSGMTRHGGCKDRTFL